MDRRHARTVLGLPSEATDSDVERAFRRRAHSAHPDRGGTADLFRQLQEAREVLLRGPGTAPSPLRVRRSWWQRLRRRLIRRLPLVLLPRHLRRRGRHLR